MVWKLKKAQGTDGDEGTSDAVAASNSVVVPDDSSNFATKVEAAEPMAASAEAPVSAPSKKRATGAAAKSAADSKSVSPSGAQADDWSLDAFAPYKPPQRSGSAATPQGSESPDELLPIEAPEEIDFTRVGVSARPVDDSNDFQILARDDKDDKADLNGLDWTVGETEAVLPADEQETDDDGEEDERPRMDLDEPIAVAPSPKSTDSVAPAPIVAMPPPEVVVTPAPPPPAAPAPTAAKPRLTVQLGPFSANYDLSEADMVVGRPDPKTGAVPEISVEWDDAISRRHLQITHKAGRYWASDLGSKNGSLLNDRSLAPGAPVALSPGDVIRIGERTTIVFEQ